MNKVVVCLSSRKMRASSFNAGQLLTLAVFAIAAALGVQAVQAASQERADMVESVTLGPGVVAGLTDCTIYLMEPGGGIAAVAIATGKPRWRTIAASQPLLVHKRRLVASSEPADQHSLTIVTLDSGSGARVNSGRLALPEDVRASTGDSPGSSFSIRAEPSPQGVLIIWKSVRRVLSGRVTAAGPPPPTIKEGAALFDSASGRITQTVPLPTPAPAAAHEGERAGNYLIQFQPSVTNPANSTTIKRWNGADHTALATVEIPVGSNALAISADGRFARGIIGQTAGKQGVIDYRWRIYSLDDGALAATCSSGPHGAVSGE